MKVVLSFDDGRHDAFAAFKILRKYSLKATFHITTGFIDGTFVTDEFGKGREPLSIKQIQEMNRFGMEISSHGDTHVMDDNDFLISKQKIQNWCRSSGKIGFSVPQSQYTDESLKAFIEDNEDNLSYIRVGRSPKCYSLISKIHYVLYRIFHFQFCYNHFNSFNIIKNVDHFKIYSLVIKKDSKPKSVKKFISKYNSDNSYLVLMFHSIVKKPKNKWEYSLDDFENLCSYLSKETQVVTLKEMVMENSED